MSKPILAALLDENGVYLRMDELPDKSALTERHLPKITACDLPPGEYRWVPSPKRDKTNPYGGQFVSIAWQKAIDETRAKALAEAAASPRRAPRKKHQPLDHED